MIGIFRSEYARLRTSGKNWLETGIRVYHFRKDVLSSGERSELESSLSALRIRVKSEEKDVASLQESITSLKQVMTRTGGAHFPQTYLGDNVDFALWALILYIGVTTFFIKHFEIPTNSMWPTFHGMTAEVWTDAKPAPNTLNQAGRFAAKGTSRYTLKAPAKGELLVPLLISGDRIMGLARSEATKRKFFVIPGPGIGYFFEIAGMPLQLTVPADFELEFPMPIERDQSKALLHAAWFPEAPSFWEALQERIVENGFERQERIELADGRTERVGWARTGLQFEKGDTVLSFDLHRGDRLIVDRFSYHFKRPKVGDGLVFRTGGIDNLSSMTEQYYIKRLAGTPGVNGAKATGSAAFGRNSVREAPL